MLFPFLAIEGHIAFDFEQFDLDVALHFFEVLDVEGLAALQFFVGFFQLFFLG